MSQKNFFVAALPLMLAIMIDGMGLGLLFPVLNSLIIDPNHSFLSAQTSSEMRNFLYGFTLSIFMFSWFFGAALLGDLSDIVGRKKTLLISLFGAFIGYLLSAFAVIFANIYLLILGRIIAGLTAGSQAIAQAAIIDLSTEENKVRNIGLILFATSLGFVFGPLFGGILSDNHLVSWFNFTTPLYFTALISLLSAILLWFFFDETFAQTASFKIQWHRAIHLFISAFKHFHVRNLSITFLAMMLGWSNYYSFISLFLLKKYQLSTTEIGLFMALLAVGFGVGFSIVVNYCTKRYALKNCLMVGLALSTIASLLTVFINNPLCAWLCALPFGIAMAVSYTLIINLFSNQADSDSQGWVMGVTGAIMAFSFGATALLSSTLANVDIAIPLICSAVLLGISGWLIRVWQ